MLNVFMQKYDDKIKCRKCGDDCIRTRYNSALDSMERECMECHFFWRESPLDREEDSQTDAKIKKPK